MNEAKSTTTMSSESTTTHRSSSAEQPLYRLDGNNGQACILLQVDALITVKYRTKKGEDEVRSDSVKKIQEENCEKKSIEYCTFF